MILGTRKTLNDHITEALLGKSLSVHELQAYLGAKNTNVTVQGIYKALRELIGEDIVVKHKKTYSISTIWRDKLNQLTGTQEYSFKLSPNKKVSYTFNKLEHIDAFWKHSLNDLDKETGDCPTFDFCPHNFWLFVPGRYDSEIEYVNSFLRDKKYIFSIIGGDTQFDKERKRDYTHDFHKINLDTDIDINRRDHITVMGPYIITTRVSLSLAQQTDKLYDSAQNQEELEQGLQKVFKRPGTILMTIEHKQQKAKKLRKRIAKDFYVPRELIEKFDLF